MKTSKLTSSVDFTKIASQPDTYYIIEEDLVINPTDFLEFKDLKGDINVKVANNCVFDFRGGALRIDPSAAVTVGMRFFNLNLNGAQVSAASYCLFYGITVSGFENTEVKAEWFNTGDYSNGLTLGGEEVYINRAIVAANGCPVVLEKRQYRLRNPIVFDFIGVYAPQTLISPGIIQIEAECAAIEIRTLDVTIDAAYIMGRMAGMDANGKRPDISTGLLYTGTGILFSANAYRCNINVQLMTTLHTGIAIIPDGNITQPGQVGKNAGIQYAKINFQYIWAYRCIYIDIFSKRVPNNGNWFNESQITGGQLHGYHGIYYADPEFDTTGMTDEDINNLKNSIDMDGTVFNNIGLEGLTGLPLRLRNLHFCKFLNLRMSEALPGINDFDSTATWIDMKNVKDVEISVKGYLRPKHYKAENHVNNVVLRGSVIDNDWPQDHFDTLVFMSMPKTKLENSVYGRQPVQFATSSIQPYNMVKTIDVGNPASTLLEMRYCTLDDLFPITHPSAENEKKFIKIKVLPRLVMANVNNGSKLTVDLAGFDKLVPGFFEIKINLNNSGTLVFMVDKPEPKQGNSLNIVGSQSDESGNQYLTITKSGSYHIELNASFDIVITKIS